jgi:ribosomal protein L35
MVDHTVLRHLNIEKDSEQYRKLESSNVVGMGEKLQKNIEALEAMLPNAEVKPAPTHEEKSRMRDKMFSFLDESRMEETRLVHILFCEHFNLFLKVVYNELFFNALEGIRV